jgi:hypothetical protein
MLGIRQDGGSVQEELDDFIGLSVLECRKSFMGIRLRQKIKFGRSTGNDEFGTPCRRPAFQ